VIEMIELPEAATIARQMTKELKGKRILSAVRGNAPHKFAFYSGPAQKYATTLRGKTMGDAVEHGSLIVAHVSPGHVLVLGGGGERIVLHESGQKLPKKHHLLLRFEDDTALTVTVQGWGSALLLKRSEFPAKASCAKRGVPPLSSAFSAAHFKGLFETLWPEDRRSVKYFMISEPGVLGVGNGYLQDILFAAGIHPRRRAVDLSARERGALHKAVRSVLREAVKRGGRDSERDLFGRPGGYVRVLHSKAVGRPCPRCGTPIQKIQYLGGASYFCPSCQPE
jgi:formamidopyrimidine-DNA glycosylase